MANRALLVFVGKNVVKSKLEEFRLLAEVAGYEPAELVVQQREPDSRYYVGSGKLSEIKDLVRRLNVDTLITYHELKPRQHFNLERELNVRVLDRVHLILEIFSKRAGTKEAKLQIELVRLKHELPRIKEYIRLAKIGEQIGFHGAGEYAVEAYYRYVRQRISVIRRELQELRSRKRDLVVRRRCYGLPEVVLTGYTGAGKTTLFNRLTKDFKYRDGRPFATLSTYSHVVCIDGAKVILTDTIGFIDDLPPLLVEAFYATIEELAHADLVLLIIDSSDDESELTRKLMSSLRVFDELSIPLSKVLPVLNKIDLISEEEVEARKSIVRRYFDHVVSISAERGYGMEDLRRAVLGKLSCYKTIMVYADGFELPSWIFDVASITFQNGVMMLRVHEQNLNKVLSYLLSKGLKAKLYDQGR